MSVPGDENVRTPRSALSVEEEEGNKKNSEEEELKKLPAVAALPWPLLSGVNESGLKEEENQLKSDFRAAFEPPNAGFFSEAVPAEMRGHLLTLLLDGLGRSENADVLALEGFAMSASDSDGEDRLSRLRETIQAGARKSREAVVRKEKKKAAKGEDPKYGLDLADIEKVWLAELEDRFPEIKFAHWWKERGKEYGQAKQLLKKYGKGPTVTTIRYVIRNWDTVNAKIFKGNATFPTLGMILKLHDHFVPTAQEWRKFKDDLDAFDKWRKENPKVLVPPVELRNARDRALKFLKGS